MRNTENKFRFIHITRVKLKDLMQTDIGDPDFTLKINRETVWHVKSCLKKGLFVLNTGEKKENREC